MHLTPAMVDDLMAIEPLAAHDLIDGLIQAGAPGLPVGRRHMPGAQPHRRGGVHGGGARLLPRVQPALPDLGKGGAHHLRDGAFLGGIGERVFSLVKNMFGKDQLTAMADFIQGSLMLRYNQRRVG